MSIYTEPPKETFNVWGTVAADIISGDAEEPNKRFSMIPHLFYEFNNDPTVKVVNAQPGEFCALDSEILKKYLVGVTKEDTKLCFDDLMEGDLASEVSKIYDAIKGTNIRPDQIYFFSGAINNDFRYEQFCNANRLEKKFKIYGCNTWEYFTKKSFKGSDIRNVEYNIALKNKVFLCFNRVMREHRLALLMLIINRKLLDSAFYSFFLDAGHGQWVPNPMGAMNVTKCLLSENIGKVIEQQFTKSLNIFPLILNTEANNNKNYLDMDDLRYFNDSYFSLVTETFFFNNYGEGSIFFTEKIFKPIAMKHPFVITSRPQSLEWLRKMGYRTFHPYIDETYDTIDNDEYRLLAIVNEVERLSKQTPEEWMEWQRSIKPIVEYNHSVFVSKEKYLHAFSRPEPPSE